MLDELRDRIASFLDARQTAVLCAWGWGQPWALPVRYRRQALEITCLLPAWAGIGTALDDDDGVLLIVQDAQASETRWLQYQGKAIICDELDWAAWGLPPKGLPQNRYTVLCLIPRRIDLIDEARGWGFRETLDLAP